jgi:hypothetical protein
MADDLTADPAERAMLEGGRFAGVVMAGVRDHEGFGWLVEVFVDDISGDVTTLAAAVRALTACAAVGSPGR